MSKELENTKAFLQSRCIANCGHNANESCICKIAICLKEIDNIEQALQRLESIDNSNPSEALECLEEMYELSCDGRIPEHSLYEYIKQALLKAQEPKQYLKWEDLEFDHKPKYIDVKMGDNKYTLVVGYNVTGCELVILRNKKQQYFFLEVDKQLFNDLHLERVEE